MWNSLDACLNITHSCYGNGRCIFNNNATYQCNCFVRYDPSSNCRYDFSFIWHGIDLLIIGFLSFGYFILLCLSMVDIFSELSASLRCKLKLRHMLMVTMVVQIVLSLVEFVLWGLIDYESMRDNYLFGYYVVVSVNDSVSFQENSPFYFYLTLLSSVFLGTFVLTWIEIATKISIYTQHPIESFWISRIIIIISIIVIFIMEVVATALRSSVPLMNIIAGACDTFWSLGIAIWMIICVAKMNKLIEPLKGSSMALGMKIKDVLSGLLCAILALNTALATTMVVLNFSENAWRYLGFELGKHFLRVLALYFGYIVVASPCSCLNPPGEQDKRSDYQKIEE